MKTTRSSRHSEARERALAEDTAKLVAAGVTCAPVEGRSRALDVTRRTNLETEYVVRLAFPASYPLEPPVAKIVKPPGCQEGPHQFGGGNLCISLDWRPTAHDIVAFLAAVDAYLALFERWNLTGEGWDDRLPPGQRGFLL